MATQFEKLKTELNALSKMGIQLYYSMCKECEEIDASMIKDIEDAGWVFVSVNEEYQKWYTKAGNDSNLLIVFYVQIMPDDLVMQLHR
ncbi:hypothetical protein M8T10_15015, partial [Enterobacter kobei]